MTTINTTINATDRFARNWKTVAENSARLGFKFSGVIKQKYSIFKQYRAMRRQQRYLESLSDVALRDIGLNRVEVIHAANLC